MIPARTKAGLFPYLILLVIGLGVADDWGLVDLTGQPAAPRHHRPAKTAAPPASRAAKVDIPHRYLRLYRRAGADHRVPWSVLAGIGKVESDHGRSSAPGVRSGVNRFGCCAGPMQFNLRNGPPSTWDAYGRGSPYRAEDAIPAAARLLVANGARRDLNRAIWLYNHSSAYVAQVRALARRYQKGT